jgi:hypothetical protein
MLDTSNMLLFTSQNEETSKDSLYCLNLSRTLALTLPM